jgi:hypothetical protein
MQFFGIMHEGYNVQFILFESNIILVYFANVQFVAMLGYTHFISCDYLCIKIGDFAFITPHYK